MMMEGEYRRVLECYRIKFRGAVTTERLLSPLVVSHVISTDELQAIQNEQPSQRVDKLLDVLQRKDYHTFKKFCVVLETTYPYMLNCMFLGVDPPALASASARLEKSDQNKPVEPEVDSPRHIQCGTRRISVGRSTSMTGHDLCKDRYSLLKNELKAVKWDLEQARNQLRRTERERDSACRELAELSGHKCINNMESENNTKTNDNYCNSDPNKDCQRLKHEYVNVLTELQILRQQNSDLTEKNNVVSQEADYFRKQHRTVLNKCDLLVREAQSLQRKYEDTLREREKMKQDYEEIVLLREREKIDMKERLHYDDDPLVEDRFQVDESMEKDYDELLETHRELRTEYNHVFNQLKSLEGESGQLKEQFDILIRERDNLIGECNALKHQCEADARDVDSAMQDRDGVVQDRDNAIKDRDNAFKDRDNAIKALQQAQKERDSSLRDCDQIMNLQVKTAKELAKLTEERNAVINEYRLIMSERDNVHRETDKIQDELHTLQAQNKTMTSDNEKLYNHNVSLQEELNLVAIERDKTNHEMNVMNEQLNQLLLDKNTTLQARNKAIDEYEMLKQERDAARKERSEALIHRDKILKECFQVKQKQDLASKGEGTQMDAFKKQLQIISKELTSALHEADTSKQRCDWALGERDKAILECKRLQTSYVLLQDEHEHTVTDLNEILCDSEHVRAQHSDMMVELMALRTRIESQLGGKSSSGELVSSRDSAIDTDSTEWETESVVLEKANHDNGLGIVIGGGHDTPLMSNDTSIIITDITKGSLADGKLRINDHLVKVNDVDLTNVAYHTALQAISEASIVSLTVRRRRSSSIKSLVHPVRLTLSDGKDLGIHIDNSKFISFITPGSVAAQDPVLAIGDKIVAINGLSVENLSQLETERLMSSSMVSLAVQKPKMATSSQVMHSLLEEVKDKMNYESDLYQHLQSNRKRILMNDSYSEMGSLSRHTHGRGTYSGRSSPLSTEEPTSTPDSVSEPALNSSTSLTPLYEDGREQVIQTDSSDASIVVSSEHVDSQQILQYPSPLHSQPHPSPPLNGSVTSRPRASSMESNPSNLDMYSNRGIKDKPQPPIRTSSYITAVTSQMNPPKHVIEHQHPILEYATSSPPLSPRHGNVTAGSPPGYGPSHAPSNSLPDPDFLDGQHTSAFYARMSTSQRPRGSRPQSAPATRHQYLPYTSHTDPLALAPPKIYPAGPPVSVAVLKSRTVPFYTATSYVIPRYNTQSVETQHCMPVRCRRDSHGPVTMSRSHGGLVTDSNMAYHRRQGSSHSADEHEFRSRHLSQQSYDSSVQSQSLSRKHHRMSLPPPGQFSSQPVFPSSPGSGESAGSVSSGHVTPVRTQSTPIVPVMEGEILAFDFSGSMPPDAADNRDHEPRQVHIEKKDTLGISIAPGYCGGIYVCNVKEGSVAQKAGLKYGDQLLEYNGVNLRCATYEQAAKILKESGNSVTILAQFNPQRNWDADFNLSASEPSTACSTPVNRRKVKRDDSTITPPLPRDEQVVPVSDVEPPGDLRYVHLNRSSASLGFSITGGNAIGIFVSELDIAAARPTELNVGDQILEYNGVDMTSCTAEQAMLELCNPTLGSVQALVQYNPTKFNATRDQPGDSFYVRALYDRAGHSKDELSFKKGDILYITDSMYHGYVGCWKACLVSPEDAQKRENGIIPSRMKAEQEILLRRSIALAHGDDHKLSGRRSLFRRSKKSSHGLAINHSREGSDSAASTTTICPDLDVVSYQTVEKLDSHIPRCVILFGPFAAMFCDKLATDFPYKFVLCKSELMNLTEEKVQKKVAEGKFVDYKWKGGQLSCLTLAALKTSTDKHSLVTVSPQAIERLHALQVYPIVLYIKFKSFRHIKELRDSKFIQDKITSRDAKDKFDQMQKLERDYRHVFNATVHGNSTSHICTAIQEAVAEQQKKTIWVPLSSV